MAIDTERRRRRRQRFVDNTGLLPMELAETPSGVRNYLCNVIYLGTPIQKLFTAIWVIVFVAGAFCMSLNLLLSNSLDTIDKDDEIMLVSVDTGNADAFGHNLNTTTDKASRELILLLNNTELSSIKKKREISHTEYTKDLAVTNSAAEKDILKRHGIVCQTETESKTCDEIIAKLKIIANNDTSKIESILEDSLHEIKMERSQIDETSPVITRQARNLNKFQDAFEHISNRALESGENYMSGYADPVNFEPRALRASGQPITDNYLLARLLIGNDPHVQDIYDVPMPEYDHLHSNHRFPHLRYYSQLAQPDRKGRNFVEKISKIHPQDVDILISFITSKPQVSSPLNSSKRDIACPVGTLPCDSGDDCVSETKWCDGVVDCSDVSDEVKCSCKSRVDKARLCDGYFDCPFGEDEMGCFDCSQDNFSCGDNNNPDSRPKCFSKDQRCDNIIDCPNHRDEADCNMLAPTLNMKPLFSISNTEGFLQRNFKGDWYSVCKNPYMWAHDVCRREAGIIIRPPYIQLLPIDPLLKVKYLNTVPGGVLQTSDTCFDSSAIYVTCPDLLCGTRVSTTLQSLRENPVMENQFIERSKRFLFKDYHHPIAYFAKRLKRDTHNFKNRLNDFKENIIGTGFTRDKRTERSVVGGKPSMPAAWPWMVAVYRDGSFHCGGVVLTQHWIISAAHCVHKFWDHYYEVQAGMLRRFSFSPQEQNHLVTHVISNQEYSQQDMKNDLSLLRVAPAIQFSRWVRPICLPSPDTAGSDWFWGPSPGTVCTAVGWGATIEHGPDPDHLHEVEVPVWESCKYSEDREGKEICAGVVQGGKDTCQGDGGGPLLCRNPLNLQQWYLAGIASHENGCARKDEPGVYTRVSLFVKWIRYHMASKSLPIVQPIQDCPGFKCKSGIKKCLANKTRCDEIIDCLDGEDEIGCIFMKTVTQEDHNDIGLFTLAHTGTNNITNNTPLLNMLDNFTNVSESKTKNTLDCVILNYTIHENVDEVKKNENNTKMRDINLNRTSVITEVHNVNTSTKNVLEQSRKTIFIKNNIKINLISTQTSVTDVMDNHVNNTLNETGKFEHTLPTGLSLSGIPEKAGIFNISIKSINEDLSTITASTRLEEQAQLSDISITTPSSVNIQELKFSKAFANHLLKAKTGIAEDLQTIDDSSSTERITTERSFQETTQDNMITTSSTTPIIEETTLDNTNFDYNNKSSNESVIQLLPELTSTEKTSPEDIKEIKPVTGKVIITSLFFLINNTVAEKLTEVEDNKEMHKIEEIIIFETQPAKIRRKHDIPTLFQCRSFMETVPYKQRCDHKSDCEDGSDEIGCNCMDYLSTTDESLLCDGVFDCADGQDEIDCYSCPEDMFLCKMSQTCIPIKFICDGKSECAQNEDELNCLALSNGKELIFDIDERPLLNLEGYLTERHENKWNIICENTLSMEELQQTAMHACRYLGFRSAISFDVKYISVKDETTKDIDSHGRNRRQSMSPIQFTYRETKNKTATNVVIQRPEEIKEHCVPNITKTCKSLYVYCDRSLFSSVDSPQMLIFNRNVNSVNDHSWPWIAKVFLEGEYKCTGVLVHLSWVLVSDSCLWENTPSDFITVVLGSHRTLMSTTGPFEQQFIIDVIKNLKESKSALLHLSEPAKYSNEVKPMVVTASGYSIETRSHCVAAGQDNKNNSISILLEEDNENCTFGFSCFKRKTENNICLPNVSSDFEWAGIISCHTKHGWNPVASFVESKGECGVGSHILATDINNLRLKLNWYSSNSIGQNPKVKINSTIINLFPNIQTNKLVDNCEGTRCNRGRCVRLSLTCDGIKHCEDGKDEMEAACDKKHLICKENSFQRGCECLKGEMKCQNGKCVSKEFFLDGKDDCGDGSDEYATTCTDYLKIVRPSHLCDGVLHCHNRMDENPYICKCVAERSFGCSTDYADIELCVASDAVCDGVYDCPYGDDEKSCIGLYAPPGAPYGRGQVIVRSHGVWYSKCFSTKNHTKSELEAICRDLGFSGDAKEIKAMDGIHPHNAVTLDLFQGVVFNKKTVIKMRTSSDPIAKATFNNSLTNCFPVFIECY